jgi:hypothetical protein
MKKILISFIITFCFISSNSQSYYGQSWANGGLAVYTKYNNISYIFDTTISFAYNTLTPNSRGNANICDSNGNIKFISNGLHIYDKYGFFIENGDTLCSDYFNSFENSVAHHDQACIFLPMDSGKCYFINAVSTEKNIDSVWFGPQFTGIYPMDVLQYSIIDMNGNNGVGKVIKRNVPLVESGKLSQSQMMACRHSNGKDWWLLKKALDSNHVYTFLVTQDTIYNKGIQRMPFAQNGKTDYIGQMMFNNDGTQMATTQNDFLGFVYLADFDRCYGVLSNYQQISVPTQTLGIDIDSSTQGLCFSPNNKFLYVCKYSHILQYDLQNKSWFHVSEIDTTDTFFAGYHLMNVAQDGKLYIGNWHGISKQMSVIDNPNGAGASCNFCRKCFRSPKIVDGWLSNPPCMPNYGLGAKTCYPSLLNPPKEDLNTVEVYPNPASTKIVVRCQMSDVSKELYNSVGQLVLSTKENEIDVRNLNSGMYYLKVGNQTKKVVVE